MVRPLVNEAITAPEVLLCDENGVEMAIMPRAQALALARARHSDLVQTDASSSPPRCRLVAPGATARAARQARIAQGEPPKEIRVTTAMGAHDLEARRRQAATLLEKGYHVKLSARLARTERANPTAARALLEQIAAGLAAMGRVERQPFAEKGALSLLLAPREE